MCGNWKAMAVFAVLMGAIFAITARWETGVAALGFALAGGLLKWLEARGLLQCALPQDEARTSTPESGERR